MTDALFAHIMDAMALIPPEPFLGAWSAQEPGSATKLSLKGRQFLIVNPVDLVLLAQRDATTLEADLKDSILSRPFFGLAIRDLDRDPKAREEFLAALNYAMKGD
jgi:hypothetical protein